MAPVALEPEEAVQAWGRRHRPVRTCEEGCDCPPFTSLSVLYPRFTADGVLRAEAVFVEAVDSYVCTSGDFSALISNNTPDIFSIVLAKSVAASD